MALSGFTGLAQELARVAVETETLLGQIIVGKRGPAPRLVEAMNYAALGPGKRLRPFFVVAASRLFDVPETYALRTGAALECMHCYSLVHDDLPAMDNDDLRRGQPTVHKAFDEQTAILAGDALQSLAFEILAQPETHPDASIRVLLIGELAKAAGKDGMAGGQMLDLQAEQSANQDLDAVIQMQGLKTGALFGFACEAGAILGGGERGPLRQYAEHIGLAFQIADDILDIESVPGTLGKATQKDKAKGKVTYIDLMGLDGAKARARLLTDAAIASLTPYGPRADVLVEAARFIVSRRK